MTRRQKDLRQRKINIGSGIVRLTGSITAYYENTELAEKIAKMTEPWPKQRNLDAVTFLVEINGQTVERCTTDIPQDVLYQLIKNRDAAWLRGLIYHLHTTLRDLGDELDVENVRD